MISIPSLVVYVVEVPLKVTTWGPRPTDFGMLCAVMNAFSRKNSLLTAMTVI